MDFFAGCKQIVNPFGELLTFLAAGVRMNMSRRSQQSDTHHFSPLLSLYHTAKRAVRKDRPFCVPHFAPPIFFSCPKRKRAAPGPKEKKLFKTPFQYDRLSWARSHPAALSAWNLNDACAAFVSLGAGLAGTLGTGFRFPTAARFAALPWAFGEG